MADISNLSDDDLKAIADSAPPVPPDLGQRPAPTDTGGLNITMTPHPHVSDMTDEQLEQIANGAPVGEQPTAPSGPLANAPTDTTGTSMAKGAATAAIKGLGHIPGFAGDLQGLTDYLVARAHSAATGIPVEEIQKRNAALRQRMKSASPALSAIPSPPSGEDISEPILARTGEYQPTSGPGRAAMAGIEAGTSMLGPGALMGAARGARAGLDGLALARRALTSAPKAIPGGAVAGTTGDFTSQVTGDPLLGMAAGVAIPYAGAKAVSPVGKYIAPIVGDRFSQAASKFTKLASDPQAALKGLKTNRQQILPDASPTTAEVSGDIGLAQGEKAARQTNPEFDAQMKANQGERNEARVAHLNSATKPADVMAPSKMYQAHLDRIDADTQATVDKAAHDAELAHAKLPPDSPPEVAGAKLRDAVADAADKARAARSKLYDAVDPEGKLSVVTSDARSAAHALAESIDPNVSIPSKFAEPIIEMVGKLEDVTPFKKLTDLDATISGEMAKAKQSGDYVGHGQLVKMKQAVQSDIHNAIENQAKWHEHARQRGLIGEEETVGSALEREAREYSANRKTGSGASARVAGAGTQRETRVSGPSGKEGKAGEQSTIPPGTEGVSGNEPNFDPDAAARLAAAKQAHGEYAQTYREGAVAPTLKDTGFKGQYKMPDSGVPASAFPSGDKGYTATSAFLKAAKNDPQAVSALQDIALGKLRDTMKDGVLTPAGLAKWKQQYGNSLRALDEVAPGFSNRFNNIAKATDEFGQAVRARQNELANAQKGSAARFLGKTDPQEVETEVGRLLKANDGPTQMRVLVDELRNGGKIAALKGLRRAGIDYMMREMTNAGMEGETRILSSAKLRNFVDKNRATLESLFQGRAMENIDRIVADMERQQKMLDAQATKGGSDTTKGTAPLLRKIAAVGAHGSALTGVAIAALEAYEKGGVLPAAGVAATYPLYLIAEKLRAHGIEKIDDLYRQGLADPDIGAALLQRGIDEKGKLNTDAFNRLVRALSRSTSMQPTYQKDSRLGRASGGKVSKIDYAAKAAELIRMAEKAKKAHSQQTSGLLKVPDELIASALKLASQRA